RSWFGSAEAIRRRVPAASGVGHGGEDLVLHALAVAEAGQAVDNPNQVPAYHYSTRYGPVPPCFAQATRVPVRGYPTAVLIRGPSFAGPISWWKSKAWPASSNV